MGEKTEKATPKKLRDARKKGQVAKSQDLPSAFTFIASIVIVLYMATTFYDELGGYLVNLFSLINHQNLENILGALWMQSILVIFNISLPVLVVVSIIGVLVNFLAVGPVWAPEVFKFDPKKFNMIQNLKSKFKLKTFVELLKSIIKIGIASYLIYDVIYKSLPVLTKAVSLPMISTLIIFQTFLIEVVVKVGLLFIVIAIVDFLYQKQSFASEMKMEKFEIKQEYKNTEGDPLIKSKRRQIAQEIAYQEGPAAGVRQAKAVVTNPTHLAIAIAYERGKDVAPYITAKGKDHMAETIIKLAHEYNIPVVRNIKLARRLWDGTKEYEFVTEDVYGPLSQILRWIESLNTDQEYQLEMTED